MSNVNLDIAPPRNYQRKMPKGLPALLSAFLGQAGLSGNFTFKANKKIPGSAERQGTVRVHNENGRCKLSIQPGDNDTAFEGYLNGMSGKSLWGPLEAAFPDNIYPVPEKKETVEGDAEGFDIEKVIDTLASSKEIVTEYKEYERELAELYEKQKAAEEAMLAIEADIEEHQKVLADPKFAKAKQLIDTLKSVMN